MCVRVCVCVCVCVCARARVLFFTEVGPAYNGPESFLLCTEHARTSERQWSLHVAATAAILMFVSRSLHVAAHVAGPPSRVTILVYHLAIHAANHETTTHSHAIWRCRDHCRASLLVLPVPRPQWELPHC